MLQQPKKVPFKFIWFASLFLLAILIIENINHRFWLNDFKVYYGAAQAFLAGTQVYGILFALGSGYYKYSPFVLLLVIPFTLFSYSAAAVLQYLFLAVVIIALLLIAGHIINKYLYEDSIKTKNFFLFISFICVVNHFIRELHLGNINVVLLLLLCLSLLSILKSNQIFAGVFLAFVIITKPFFALMFLPFLLHNKWKAIFSTGITLIFLVICPAIIIGMTKNIELHKEWLHTMLEHNSSFQSYNTIDNLARHYIFPNFASSFQTIVIVIIILAYVTFHYLNRNMKYQSTDSDKLQSKGLIIEWFMLIALMPSLFRTDTQHFLFSLPLVMVLLVYIARSKNKIWIVLFALLIFLYGGNTSELLGKKLSNSFDEAGLLGISNLILVVMSALLFREFMKKSRELH